MVQMDSGNVAQLVVPQTPPLERRDRIQGPDKDVEFLSLRLLNKRSRVRLSPTQIDYSRFPGKLSLIAVGNTKGWLAAAICKENNTYHILLSTLSELRAAFESGQPDPLPFIPFSASRPSFSVPGTPTILKFALNDERFIVGFLEGPILVYNTNDLFTSSEPNHIFALPGDASTIPRDISPNPGDSPELIAIMRGVHGQEPGHQIDIVDVQGLKHVSGWRKGSDPNAAPVSISWSPKGKQIAIGLQSGDMVLYSPLSTGSPKSHLVKPRSTPAEFSSLLSTTWLSNPTFYTVFSSPEASSTLFDPQTSDPPSHTHFISTHDSKTRSAVDVELRDPCPPFGAKRPPGPLTVVLRNWYPTKFIIFCGDGPSTDIGVIGTLPSDDPSNPGDQWASFNLEETSTASLPLDEELNDLALLGLEIDLTSSKSIRMSEQPDDGTPDLPPSPILYAYTSDGTIVAWHVLNSNGEAYPGMHAVGTANVIPAAQTQQKVSAQAFGVPSPRISPPASQESTSVFNRSNSPSPSFGQPAPSFNQAATTSPLPPASAFGQPASPASSAPAPGFGAFGGANPSSKFGSTGFGSAGASALGKSSAAPAFGSTGFGGGSTTQGDQPNPAPAPAFGTTGFGGASKPTTTPAFGTTGFGRSAAPTFGASGFGAKPAVPAFGQSGFGATPSGASAFGSTGGGGFAAFATQGSSSFGAPVDPAAASKPNPTSPAFGKGSFGQPSSAFGSQSAFGAGGQGPASPPVSAFGSGGEGQAAKAPTSAFGQQATQPTSPFGTFGQRAETSAFGSGGVGPASKASPPPSAFGQPATQPQPTSGSFGQKDGGAPGFGKTGFGTSTSPPPRESGGFGGFGALGDALQPSLPSSRFDSPPGSPPSPTGSLPDSPELRPTSQPMKPTSSYMKPAEGFGTMNKPTSSFIKPAGGFGAAAQAKSPPPAFGQQKPASPAFGATGFGAAEAARSASTVAPTFGSTSALGHSKPLFGTSSFGSPPQAAAAEPSKPITGGFGAFSSGGGGFASFANADKSASFADILSSAVADKPKSSVAPLAFGAPSSSKVPTFSALNEHKVSSTVNSEKSASTFSSDTAGVRDNEPNEGKKGDKEPSSEGKFANNETSPSSTKREEPAFNLPSVREPASKNTPSAMAPKSEAFQKKLEIEPQTEKTESNKDLDEADESKKEEEVDETASEPFSLTDDGFDDSASDEGDLPRSPTRSLSEEDESGHVTLPTTPQDRTPRSTPTPTPVSTTHEDIDTPEVKVISPPSETAIATSNLDEDSTTPPGSPEKSAKGAQTPLPTPVAPTPVVPASVTSPFGLGIGRPSSRPIRSSPLASAPILSAEDEESGPEVSPSKSAPPTSKSKPSEPKASFGQWTPSALVPSATPPATSGEFSSTSKPRRPKTPPLLGTPPSVPSTIPLQPRVSPTELKTPTGLPVQPRVASPVANITSASAAEKEEIPKHPMQVEFLRAYQDMMKELVQLYKKAQEMTVIRPVISEPRGLDKLVMNNQEFVPGQYSHGDLKAFATMISILQKRVVPLLELGKTNKRSLRDLQNLALISETKKEEVSRWVRARQDPDFAKNLRPHALGPEHSENQIRLRKAVQMTRDRIQQCEDEMESLKKRLEQHKSGKVGLRPPSLDTIDRTCRNIQLALEERTKILEQLHDRIETLSPKASQKLQSSQPHIRSPVSNPAPVTPPFASVAAAALNSERSSLRLKSVLLSARKEPLLTTKVIKLELSRQTGPRIQLPPQSQRPEWKLPPVPPLDTSQSPSISRRRTGKRHGAVQLKEGTLESGTKPVAFDWGSLPKAAPMDKLSMDVRGSRGKNSSGFFKHAHEDDLEWDQEAEHDYK